MELQELLRRDTEAVTLTRCWEQVVVELVLLAMTELARLLVQMVVLVLALALRALQ
jgi:hypothetical protein